MSEEVKKTNKDSEEEIIDPNEETLGATGQILLGEIEKIGGILTANPTAQAEGDFNMEVGRLRKELSEELIETEDEEE